MTKVQLSEIHSSHCQPGLFGALLLYTCSALRDNFSAQGEEGWSEGLGGAHCKTKPLGMSW